MTEEIKRIEYTFGEVRLLRGDRMCRVCLVVDSIGEASFSRKDARGDICTRCLTAARSLVKWNRDPYPALFRRLQKEAGHQAAISPRGGVYTKRRFKTVDEGLTL